MPISVMTDVRIGEVYKVLPLCWFIYSRLQAPDSRFQTPGSRLQTGFTLQAPGSRLQTRDSRFETSDSRLETPDSSLQAPPDCRLRIPAFRFQTRTRPTLDPHYTHTVPRTAGSALNRTIPALYQDTMLNLGSHDCPSNVGR